MVEIALWDIMCRGGNSGIRNLLGCGLCSCDRESIGVEGKDRLTVLFRHFCGELKIVTYAE